MRSFARPTTLEETFDLMARQPWCVLAGGTDVYPAYADRPLAEPILDISRIAELRRISRDGRFWRIGGLTTWTDLIQADLPPAFDGLKLAAREIGSIQVQNVGTIGGNLCNASPAADGVPPLLTMDAEIELRSQSGQRVLPLASFITDYRTTARRPGELLTAVLVPATGARGGSTFKKLGARHQLIISICMVAVRLEARHELVVDARVAVGACSPTAHRLIDLEKALVGARLDHVAEKVALGHIDCLSPIDDVRSTAHYRREAVFELSKRALNETAGLA